MNDPNNKLFISYSRRQREWVENRVKDIDLSSYSVWWDHKLKAGQKWWDAICEAIKECNIFLFILSEASVESIYCNAEFEYALALKKSIIPIKPVMPDSPYTEIRFPEKESFKELLKIQFLEVEDELFLIRLLDELCDLRFVLASNIESSPPDLPFPDLPRPSKDQLLSNEQVLEMWLLITDLEKKGDISTAVELCDQIIGSNTDYLGKLPQNKKSNLVQRKDRDDIYRTIKHFIDQKQKDDAKDLWDHFYSKYTDYDPDSLYLYFVETISESAVERILPFTTDLLFDDSVNDAK